MTSFDAPREFGGEPLRVALEALDANLAGDFTSRFTLSGSKAYGVTRTGVGAVDLATGVTIWETPFPDAPPDHQVGVFYDSRGPGAPVVSGDGSMVYAVLMVQSPGSGTTSTASAAQLMALYAESGKLAWTADIRAGFDGTGQMPVYVIAESEGRIVVTGDGGGVAEGVVGVVDSHSGDILWTGSGRAHAVHAETVLAVAKTSTEDEAGYPQLTGLDIATGRVRWVQGDGLETAVSGISTLRTANGLAVTVHPYSGADPYSGIIDPTTGEMIRALPGVALSQPVQDGELVYDVTRRGLRLLDPGTLRGVWELPDERRIAPENPIFFGGLVYGRVRNGMSVVLDGKTGEDITVDVPGAFIHVNEYGAIMLVDGQVVFVAATG